MVFLIGVFSSWNAKANLTFLECEDTQWLSDSFICDKIFVHQFVNQPTKFCWANNDYYKQHVWRHRVTLLGGQCKVSVIMLDLTVIQKLVFISCTVLLIKLTLHRIFLIENTLAKIVNLCYRVNKAWPAHQQCSYLSCFDLLSHRVWQGHYQTPWIANKALREVSGFLLNTEAMLLWV